MACPLWGDGSLWGDGDLWCRVFGTNPYITETDRNIHRLSVKVSYAGLAQFSIDSIRPNIDWGRSLQDWTYTAAIDYGLAMSPSVKVNFSSNASFKIHKIIPEVNVKKHQPVG